MLRLADAEDVVVSTLGRDSDDSPNPRSAIAIQFTLFRRAAMRPLVRDIEIAPP